MPASKSPTTRIAPAEGERRALRSLSAQYLVAAKLARDALLDGELEWIRLVDPDAGRLDDIVLGRPGRIDAYQVKWSEYRRQVTFQQLVAPSKVSGKPYPAPFALLAEGWKTLQQANPDRVVRAHFLTHDAPSATDGTKQAGAGNPEHLQGFLRNAWPSRAGWHTAASTDFRKTWSLRIDAIAESTGLFGPELDHFLSRCELDLGFELEEAPGKGHDRRTKDVSDLAHFLMDQVSGSSGVVHITRADLLRGLGWTDRFELSFRHDFPVDEKLYRPVEATVEAIGRAVAAHARGYIALVGPPGSGKSTALTHTLRYATGIRLVRYYAFVRDDPRLGRGEAAAFLHDLCLSLEPLAPKAGRRRERSDDLDSLRERIAELLAEMSSEWRTSGTKTVILIDGLDHIAREQSPTRSLIHELPNPSAIPDGVLVVLGTQQVGLQGDAASLRPIVAELEHEGRTLEMARLSRASIRSIVETAVDANLLDPEAHAAVERLSGGHPLALAYLVKRLSTASRADEVGAILSASTSYEGEIEADYRTYWSTLRDEREVRDLLGLISRLRGAVPLSTLETLASPSALERFAATAQHYFHQDTASVWRFFHNSFRQFVLDRTARNALDRIDPAIGKAFHVRLAKAGASEQAVVQLDWERLYHLELAGDFAGLLELEHQTLFRSQFLAGRPEWEIEEDIERCMRAAAAAGDAMAVLGLMLAQKELGDRTSAFETIDLATLELKLRQPDDRASALVSGSDLLVPDEEALAWAVRLLEAGDTALANRIFDLAEPLDLLSGVRRLDRVRHDESLDAWAKAAWRFRPLPAVVGAARQVRVDVHPIDMAPPYEDESRADAGARFHVLATLAQALVAARADERIEELRRLLAASPDAPALDLRLDVARVRRAIDCSDDRTEGCEALTRILDRKPPAAVGPTEAVRIADLICGLVDAPERADAYLQRAPDLLLADELNASDDDAFASVDALFKQARARACRGVPIDPAEIPDPPQAHGLGRVLFQRVVVRIANLWGEAIAGTVVPPSEVVRRLGPVIRFYRRSFGETTRWLDWHYAQRASGALFERMLRAAHAHGLDAFHAVLSATMADWTRRDRGLVGWSVETRRGIALAAYRIDTDATRTARILAELDTGVDIDLELYERVEQQRASMEAWLELGNREQARQARDAMLKTSFGVYSDRDDQAEDWAAHAAAAIDAGIDPEGREDAARLILTVARVLHRNHRGGGRAEAVRVIMATLSRLDPPVALQQGDWLLKGNGAMRSDVLVGIAIGQLRSSDPDIVADALIVAGRLILPFDLNSSAELAAAINTVAEGAVATNGRVAGALDLVRAVVRTRVQHRRVFDELLGIEARPPRAQGEKAEQGSLTKADGTVLTQCQVEALAATPAALAGALIGAAASKMRWDRVLSALPTTIDRPTLGSIGRWIVSAGTTAFTLRDLVRLAAAKGDRDLVEQATVSAIAASKRSGWLPRYDGGSRLAAAECFVIGDPEHGHQRALQLLVDDHLERTLAVRDLVAQLDQILPLISRTTDARAIWTELRQHLGALAEVAENPDQAPSFATAAALQPGELSTLLMLRDFDHNANALAWEARKGLLFRLEAGDPGDLVRTGLEQALAGDLNRRTAAVATIAGLAWSIPARVGGLVDLIRPLAWDHLGVIRRLAQQILLDLGEEIPEAPPSRPLPAIYSLHLPDTPMRDLSLRGGDVPRGEPLPDTSDSVDLSRLFHDAFKLIELQTGIAFATLARRFAQIMLALAPAETWSAAAERKLTVHLEAIGLKISVRRPRSLISHHAFGVLVAELCDAGALDWPLGSLDGTLLLTDSYIDTRDPVPRPEWLEVPSGKSLGEYPREKWLEAVEEAMPSLRATPDGGIVLAEWTSAVSVDSDREEESRIAIIAHPQMTLGDGMPSLYRLWRDSDYIGREYPMLYGRRDRPVAALAGGPLFSDADFLALNPRIGFMMGWQVAEEGFFRWVDATGAVMAESLWWQDGNRFLNDHAGMDAAAYQGWLVLATAEGWQRMRPKIANFLVHRAAGRSMPDRESDDGEIVTGKIDAQPLPA